MTETSVPTVVPVTMTGNACLVLTAPFHPAHDPLAERTPLDLSCRTLLTPSGSLVMVESSFPSVFRGSLTYDPASLGDDVVEFEGSGDFRVELAGLLSAVLDRSGSPEIVVTDLCGLLYEDGYGSVAVTICVADGWEPEQRARTLADFGRAGRELIAEALRDRILPELGAVVRGCGSGCDVAIPYFNMTYGGETDVEEPGRGALAVELRHLVYPDSPEPLRSASPWRDQFFYAGYAYNLLIMREPERQMARVARLLLVLDVLYIRLARTSSAADAALGGPIAADTDWLRLLAQRLRSEYQALVTPTFSYDHHALRLRDAILRSWDVEKLHGRAQDLLDIVRENVTLKLAEEQGRRLRRVNLVVGLLTGLSFVATIDAAVSLYDRLWG